MSRLLLVALLALGLCPRPTQAAEEHQFVEGSQGSSFLLRTWARTNGMPHGTVNAVARTPDGYLWLATFDGLARFDGQRFRSFDLSDGLRSNRITSLLVDRRGDLWIGHEVEGLTRYSDGRFSTDDVTGEDGGAGTVWEMLEADDGTLYLAADNGLFSRAPGERGFRREGPYEGPVVDLLVDRTGDLWITGAHGLAGRMAGTRDFTAIELPARVITSIVEDSRGAVWIGTELGLWRGVRTPAGERRWRSVIETECTPGTPSTSSLLELGPDGDLWFRPCTNLLLTSSSRLYRLDIDDPGAPRPETFDLEGVPVLSMTSGGDDGGLWLGTFGHGLGALAPRLIERWPLDESFGVQELRSVIGDGDGGLWIGAGCDASLIHFRDGRFTAVPRDPEGGPLRCVGGLARGRGGGLWLGAGGDLVRLGGDGPFARRTLIDGASKVMIYAIAEGAADEVWVGFAGHGLARVALPAAAPGPSVETAGVEFLGLEDGLASDHVHSLLFDRGGDLWIGTHRGLSRLVDGRVRTYGEDDGMAPGMVRVLHEDERGVLWIGTYGGGLARFEDGRFTRYTRDDGLYDNVVTQLLEDRRGRFWMLGNQGLFFHHRRELDAFAADEVDRLSSVYFDQGDGMLEGSGGRQPAGWQMADGRLFFPTVDGLVMIDSERIDLDKPPPTVTVEEVLVGGRRALEGGRVELAPGERDLEIHYTAPGAFDAEKTRFRYRLDGYDGAWNEVGDRRTAYYTNLPPGDYVFRVGAANRYGLWSEVAAAVPLTVLAPWWRRRASLALYLLVVTTAAVLYVVRQQERIRRGRRLLAERTEQLKQLAEMLPICSSCKKVRDDGGDWEQMEVFFSHHSNLRFSHGLCPDCSREMLDELDGPRAPRSSSTR